MLQVTQLLDQSEEKGLIGIHGSGIVFVRLQATDTPTVPEEQVLLPCSQVEEADDANSVPSLNLSLNSEFKFDHREDAAQERVKETMVGSNGFTPMVPAFFPPYVPVPYPFWASNPAPHEDKGTEASQHQVLKPIPLLPKEPVNVDELVGMSQLSIGGTENVHQEPSPLSLKPLGEAPRQSAFHANAPVAGGTELSNGKTGAIQAVSL